MKVVAEWIAQNASTAQKGTDIVIVLKRLCADTLALVKGQESTMNLLRSTMEDMVRGNASEEVSYLLRLLNKWE